MKVLVFGSRRWVDQFPIEKALRSLPISTTLVHGDARGADRIAGYVAEIIGLKVKVYPADWARYGKAAGPVRNEVMLKDNPDIELALGFTIGDTPGSVDMMRRLRMAGINLHRLDVC